jgi:hypothetical protein
MNRFASARDLVVPLLSSFAGIRYARQGRRGELRVRATTLRSFRDALIYCGSAGAAWPFFRKNQEKIKNFFSSRGKSEIPLDI